MMSVMLKTSGEAIPLRFEHKHVYKMFGAVEFCGAIDELQCVCMKRVGDDANVNATAAEFPQYFHDTTGDIFVLGSDAHGNACDVDVGSITRTLRLTRVASIDTVAELHTNE